MLKFLNKWKKQRATARELNRLTNKELADLGISRCDIDRISKQGL